MHFDNSSNDAFDSSAGAAAVLEPVATESDPFATPADAPVDPFATPADPFATPSDAPADAPAADPFATTETPADAPAEAPADAPAEEESSGVGLTLEDKPQKKGLQKKERKQFRILVLADFSGRTNRGILEKDNISSRKVRTVDADSLDKTMAAVKPEIQLPVDEKTVIPLAFAAMEDFRPDAIIQQVAAFQNMLTLRGQLQDNKKFKETAAAVRKLTGTAAQKKAKSAADAAGGAAEKSEFEKMLDRPIAPKGAEHASADALIANLVAGYGVPDADPEQRKMVKLVEDALSAGLRAVLRHPAFQGLEGAWGGVEFLVSRLNTDDELKICILDISKDELYADLVGPPTIEKTGLFQVLVEQTRSAGAVPFSLVIGDYEFDQSPQNVALLAKLASLMHAAEIPFIGGATAKVPGFTSYAKATDSGKWQPPADIALWDKIRGHKLAAHIGLTAPRFLIRMPYGPKTDAIEAFPFDEMPVPATEQYLWANGAFAAALLIGQAFLDGGWDGIEPGNDVSDLPCHMAVVDGDKEMTPCAQAWLSDRVGDLRNLGLIPVISVKNAAAVKVAGLQSIAKGGKALAANWGPK